MPPRPTNPGRQGHSVPDAPTPNAGQRLPISGDPASQSKPGNASPKWVLVARLIRPHGRRGELLAEILTDFPERFHDRTRLVVIPPMRVGTRPRELALENFWFLRSRIVMKFRGVDSINEAEALRGFEVAIPFAERAPLDAGSIYVSDLIGCRVIDLNRDGVEVGTIVDVNRESSNTDLLVVRAARRVAGEELLIPFVKAYLVRIDADGRRLEMRLPEGLLGINGPLTQEEKRAAREPS